jgi:hypothetical protein
MAQSVAIARLIGTRATMICGIWDISKGRGILFG